jgi:uncharacterized protein (DUF488 family)
VQDLSKAADDTPPTRPSKQGSLFREAEPLPPAQYAEPEPAGKPRRVFTIGHSTRKIEELISALSFYRIERLVDIRHFPTSRHNPQFNQDVLQRELPQHGIEYLWLKQLGGYRKTGYRAHMLTPDFTAGIEALERLGREKRTAYMCAEVKWFQCHRRHVSDVLAAKGWQVVHIFDETRAVEHFEKTNRIKCD